MTLLPERLRIENDPLAHVDEPRAGVEPVLITEQEVLLATAIATSPPLPHRRSLFRWPGRHRPHAAVAADAPPEPGVLRKYPPRTPDWYSDALMAREMRRL